MTNLFATQKFQFPNSSEIALAKKIVADLESAKETSTSRLLQVSPDNVIEIPENIFQAALEMIQIVADGKGFSISSFEKELGTQEAADLLQISRPYLVKLLDEEKIPFRYVGRYRRIRHEDLLRYTRGGKPGAVPLNTKSLKHGSDIANSSDETMMDFTKELEEARREAQTGDF